MDPRADEPEPWMRARERFLELADLGEQERAAALAALAANEPGLAAWVARLLENDPGPEGEPGPASRRFGAYETTRRLATGGMGEVFQARRATA